MLPTCLLVFDAYMTRSTSRMLVSSGMYPSAKGGCLHLSVLGGDAPAMLPFNENIMILFTRRCCATVCRCSLRFRLESTMSVSGDFDVLPVRLKMSGLICTPPVCLSLPRCSYALCGGLGLLCSSRGTKQRRGSAHLVR